MAVVFYASGAIAVIAAIAAIIQSNVMHSLLYLALCFLAVAVIFYTLGAPFAAALEVIVYVGAMVVLFVFVVMLLNTGPRGARLERQWLSPRQWLLPAGLAGTLLVELGYVLATGAFGARPGPSIGTSVVEPRQVSLVLFGPYILGVELASLLLLAGLVGAYHLGRRGQPGPDRRLRDSMAAAVVGHPPGPGAYGVPRHPEAAETQHRPGDGQGPGSRPLGTLAGPNETPHRGTHPASSLPPDREHQDAS